MDSFKDAVIYLTIFLPFKVLDKLFEGIGVLYGLLEYPFQQGKQKAQRVYKKLNG